MTENQTGSADGAPQLDALNGMRFFAVFHIFLYHIWSIRFEMEGPRQPPFDKVYANLDGFPAWLNNLLAHGYVSTSFFFLLSGFILAYLYWAPNGELSTTPRRFWWQRFTRIYPVHLIALLVTLPLLLLRMVFDPGAPPVLLMAASGVATATLTQAWFPPLVPMWSWPTWALSAIVFLYLIMPWLMRQLAKLSRGQSIGLLIALPVISLLPTMIFLQYFPDGAKDHRDWQIFIGSTPLFWVAHFAAGMLVSRIFRISRFEQAWREKPKPWLAPGDLALAVVVFICLMEPHNTAWRHILRHGALMPLYLFVLYDLALGRGLVARLFSLPGMGFLGQTSFSIFIWQNLFMSFGFMVAMANPQSTNLSFWFAVIGLLVMAIISTYFIEKPLAKRLRRRMQADQGVSTPITT